MATGFRVAEWLVKSKRDVVLTKESLKGKGPEYVLSNAGVELRQIHARTLQEALAAAAANGVFCNGRMSSPQPVTGGASHRAPKGGNGTVFRANRRR
jgi:hypothetical protein